MSTYLGQNFLKDSKIITYITKKISDLYHEQACTTIVEIGPGKGAITKKIKNISEHFFVIEKDPLMVEHLLSHTILDASQIINQDVLASDVSGLLSSHMIPSEKVLVVGNLPYYITSPIIRKFFGQAGAHYGGGFFMMQKEVGEKITCDASKKSYLWWLTNFAHRVQYSKTIPAKAFSPAPNVQSCLVSFVGKQQAVGNTDEFEKLLILLDHISPYKRKTMGKITKMLQKKGVMLPILSEITGRKRLEDVTWQEMLGLLSQ